MIKIKLTERIMHGLDKSVSCYIMWTPNIQTDITV